MKSRFVWLGSGCADREHNDCHCDAIVSESKLFIVRHKALKKVSEENFNRMEIEAPCTVEATMVTWMMMIYLLSAVTDDESLHEKPFIIIMISQSSANAPHERKRRKRSNWFGWIIRCSIDVRDWMPLFYLYRSHEMASAHALPEVSRISCDFPY